jgi:hypothetical protein
MPTQQMKGFFNIAGSHHFPDPGAADPFPGVQRVRYPLRHNHVESVFLAAFPQKRDIAFPVAAKGVIFADDDGPGPDPANQNVFHELFGRDRSKRLVKANTDQHINAGFGDEFGFLFIKSDQGRLPVFFKDPDGMGLKGDGHRCSSHDLGLFNNLV